MTDLYFHDIEDGESPDAYMHMSWLKNREYLVPVDPDEYVRRRDVCICALGEGFDPQPSDLHNSWCSYEPEADDE